MDKHGLIAFAFFTVLQPATVAEPSKPSSVFALSEAGIVGSNPTQGKDVWYAYMFILCLYCPCLGRGLATS
jgi:hypothetical protein